MLSLSWEISKDKFGDDDTRSHPMVVHGMESHGNSGMSSLRKDERIPNMNFINFGGQSVRKMTWTPCITSKSGSLVM